MKANLKIRNVETGVRESIELDPRAIFAMNVIAETLPSQPKADPFIFYGAGLKLIDRNAKRRRYVKPGEYLRAVRDLPISDTAISQTVIRPGVDHIFWNSNSLSGFVGYTLTVKLLDLTQNVRPITVNTARYAIPPDALDGVITGAFRSEQGIFIRDAVSIVAIDPSGTGTLTLLPTTFTSESTFEETTTAISASQALVSVVEDTDDDYTVVPDIFPANLEGNTMRETVTWEAASSTKRITVETLSGEINTYTITDTGANAATGFAAFVNTNFPGLLSATAAGNVTTVTAPIGLTFRLYDIEEGTAVVAGLPSAVYALGVTIFALGASAHTSFGARYIGGSSIGSSYDLIIEAIPVYSVLGNAVIKQLALS